MVDRWYFYGCLCHVSRQPFARTSISREAPKQIVINDGQVTDVAQNSGWSDRESEDLDQHI